MKKLYLLSLLITNVVLILFIALVVLERPEIISEYIKCYIIQVLISPLLALVIMPLVYIGLNDE